jgi:hypothetical protein
MLIVKTVVFFASKHDCLRTLKLIIQSLLIYQMKNKLIVSVCMHIVVAEISNGFISAFGYMEVFVPFPWLKIEL